MTNSLPTEGDPGPTDERTTVDPGTSAHYFGDVRDDDGAAMDSYFEAAPASPLRTDYVDSTVPALPKNTRAMTRSFDMTNYDPGASVLLWPADPNRAHLFIEAVAVPSITQTAPSPTAASAVVASGTFPAGGISGLTVALNVITVDTAGAMLFEVSNDGANWFQLATKSLTSAGTSTFPISGSYQQWRIRYSSAATNAGSANALLSYSPLVASFAWSSEQISPVSPVGFAGRVDTDTHTGAVYIAKPDSAAIIVRSWVVTV